MIRAGRAAAAALTSLALAAGGPAARAERPVSFADLPGYAADDHLAALDTFRVSCGAILHPVKGSRPALPSPPDLVAACRAAGAARITDDAGAKRFFADHFVPERIEAEAFFTGYYEPVVEGALIQGNGFDTPLLATPPDLVTLDPAHPAPGLDPALTVARRFPDGRLVALPDRAAIQAGALGEAAPPLVWLRDPVEAYFVQIQGSARIRLRDGSLRRLAYAGRNGYPYTGLGKVLVQRLHIPPSQMDATALKAWLRTHGTRPDEAGGRLMAENRSYIFFRFDETLAADAGPVGGEGVSLTALRSLAVDRNAWAYGLPFYLDADLPWRGPAPTPFRRLMIAQDTGAGIRGAARADIFFGSGDEAAETSARIRQAGTLYVLRPKPQAPTP